MVARVAYRVAQGVTDPVWVSLAARANVQGWSSVCTACGFDMVFDPIELVIERQFAAMPPAGETVAFSTRCPVCR
jgi:hypothetical protein